MQSSSYPGTEAQNTKVRFPNMLRLQVVTGWFTSIVKASARLLDWPRWSKRTQGRSPSENLTWATSRPDVFVVALLREMATIGTGNPGASTVTSLFGTRCW